MNKKSVFDRIVNILKSRRETLSVAESATAGIIQNSFANPEFASDVFEGGVTVYNAEQKISLLGVDTGEALQNNCVTEGIAEQMAKAAAEMFKSDWGIAFTGYAKPIEAMGINEAYGYGAICYQGKIVFADEFQSSKKDIVSAQEDFCLQLSDIFHEELTRNHLTPPLMKAV